MNLKDQIYQCLPAGRYAFAGLMRLADVVETEAVASAGVQCVTQPRLLINPRFVAEHAQTPEKLMMLVMHELHHVLLGHTRRSMGNTVADNFVFDCVINALLSRMFPQPAYTALFRETYPAHQFPACMLRPPDDWHPSMPLSLPPALDADDIELRAAREVYRALYSARGAGYEEIRSLLPQLSALEGVIAKIPLLGDHDSASDSGDAGQAVFASALAQLVRSWPDAPDPFRGQSLDSLLQTRRIRPVRSNTARLRELFLRIAGAGNAARTRTRSGSDNRIVESPVPCFDRRALVTRSLGATPMVYRQEVAQSRVSTSRARVQVYVDVSGSMNDLLNALYGAILDCSALVAPRICLFSTKVAEASLREIREGHCLSTAGTDIACVIEHMKAGRVRRAVLLTDGHVGAVTAPHRDVLKKVLLGVAYSGQHSDGCLAPFTRYATVLST